MRFLFVMSSLLFVAACERDVAPTAPTVIAGGEALIGKYVAGGEVAAFLGVPFAEPPVGDLRWRAPRPLAKTMPERVVTEFAPACMQTMRILDWYRGLAESFGASRDYYEDLAISEDCLYLNVWTVALETDAKLPVMVWVHGGSNKSGWSYEDNYRGHVLAPQGVVVVTVAYRQGAFGFLSHPELQGEGAVANFGIWDLIAALQWIQDNIAAFGGDPDRVTLFGESAGGENILALMFAKPGAELFHRGILQSASGYGLSMPTLDDERERGAGLAAALGLEGDHTLQQLRAVPADQVLRVYTENFDDHYHSPAVDGQLFSRSIWDDIQGHRFGAHDIVVGTNAGEWYATVSAESSLDDVILTAANHPRIGGDKALALVADEDDPRRAMDRLITADNYVCPSQNIAANRAASGGKAWMYYFTQEREDYAVAEIGAYHGAEYAYVFGVHDSYMTTTEQDIELSSYMQQYWINFAATGNPNGPGLRKWPAFARPGSRVIELGDVIQEIPAIEAEMCAAFEEWNQHRD